MSDQKDKTPYRHGRDKDEGYEPPPAPYGRGKDEGHEPPPYGGGKDEGHEPPPHGRGRDEGYEPPPRYGRGGDEGCEPPPPPPPPPPCPDPCDQYPPWGPPDIRPECCPHHPCCPDEHCCTWESVDDPCVKAASADCGLPWTIITCNCESSNEKCDCKEWDCGCYPQGTCVPCKPCEEFFPPPDGPPGGCDDPPSDDCTTANLRKQLDSLNQCISSQEGAKTKLEADIQARKDRVTALSELIGKFDGIVSDYKTKRHTLVCREDCLKGFHRDITTVFGKYSPAYLGELEKYINQELCTLELEKCCQKNLEGKLGTDLEGNLTKVTKLKWEQQQAEKEKQKADKAFETIKDLPGWLDKQFKELENLKDEIAKALNDVDPQKHKVAFYKFYWKYVPRLCRCFEYPFCCEEKTGSEEESQQYDTKKPEQTSRRYETPHNHKPADHLGCKPGDWHPSAITEEDLRALICCAWDYARKQKQALQDATDRVTDATNNLKSIKTRVKADTDSLDDRIESGLNNVGKLAPTSR